MTYQKIKPCPRCPDGGDPDLIEYGYGWKHVECFVCNLLGPGEGRNGDAIKSWNTMPAHKAPLQQARVAE